MDMDKDTPFEIGVVSEVGEDGKVRVYAPNPKAHREFLDAIYATVTDQIYGELYFQSRAKEDKSSER